MTPEMEKLINEDKKRLFGYNDLEAKSLSVPDQYQRNKYKGEIESHKWLEEERRKQAIRAPRREPKEKRIKGFEGNVYYGKQWD